ncbi:MAG TPA: sugar phosphate isomerase/epimerase [Deltaproteobacteria bacterium]|nr:sugar phosphate isomerase/epimerase [Deltaproteobacteria bacterium]
MKKRPLHVHVPFTILAERFDEIVEARINPEIYFDAESLDGADTAQLGELARGLRRNGLAATFHGPYLSLNPGAPDERVRELTVERYMQVLSAAAIFRPSVVVLHACYDERVYDGDRELWFSQSMKSWPAVADEARRVGTVIAAENIFEEEPSTLERLVRAVDSKSFGVCLDSGHLNVFSTVALERWFESVGSFIAEVHIHDNHGRYDEHLAVGDGTVDFPLFFSLLARYASDPVCTIEPHGEDVLRRALDAVAPYLEIE